MVWWLRLNFSNYTRNQGLILPKTDFDSITSWVEWRLYWNRFKHRTWPAIFEYQTTISIMYFFQAVLNLFVSKETINRLTQHPYHRAQAVAKRETDPVTVGTDSVVTALWGNLLFFSASFTLGQLIVIYNYNRNKVRKTNEEACRIFLLSTWKLVWTISRRFYFSALGAGLGSMVWPGLGTIIGMGLGDGIAELTPEPEPPSLDGGGPCSFITKSSRKHGLNHFGGDTNENAELYEELTCGCCQIVPFSSDPTAVERSPISSRECSHTICRSCVQKCHLALMERVSTYQEWISCPICKAHNAFSSHNHLVNRSLCHAISLFEKKQHLLETQLKRQAVPSSTPSSLT